eukprot:10958040-Alexandrium_andersonii.AAC.1
MLRKCRHPNIVTMYQSLAVRSPGLRGVVGVDLEFCAGGDLDARTQTCTLTSYERAASSEQVLSAL